MDLNKKHLDQHREAICSGKLAKVKAFVEAHPERLNEVRSRNKGLLASKEEKEKNSP